MAKVVILQAVSFCFEFLIPKIDNCPITLYEDGIYISSSLTHTLTVTALLSTDYWTACVSQAVLLLVSTIPSQLNALAPLWPTKLRRLRLMNGAKLWTIPLTNWMSTESFLTKCRILAQKWPLNIFQASTWRSTRNSIKVCCFYSPPKPNLGRTKFLPPQIQGIQKFYPPNLAFCFFWILTPHLLFYTPRFYKYVGRNFCLCFCMVSCAELCPFILFLAICAQACFCWVVLFRCWATQMWREKGAHKSPRLSKMVSNLNILCCFFS